MMAILAIAPLQVIYKGIIEDIWWPKAVVHICLLVIYGASMSTPEHEGQGGTPLLHTKDVNITQVV